MKAVHWQTPGANGTVAICHGRITREPITTQPAAVTCPVCKQSRSWKASTA